MSDIKKIRVDGVDYDIQASELTKVTYAELKEMRDNGGLAAGHLYRITDYEFTTVQDFTTSAGNVFDIIVLATDKNKLSHIARAVQHEGDAYFDGNDLGAWELWYDLDNDTTKYEWADSENGKGVIYRMIDEKRNDCPYDFKNALFYNTTLTDFTTTDKYYYTFSYVVSGKLYDGTVEPQVKNCHSNSMGVYIKSNKKSLNLNVFKNELFSRYCYCNTFGEYCNSNTFGDSCFYNAFEGDCSYNTFKNFCDRNTFGVCCNYNTIGYNCGCNTFEGNCHRNTIGDYCVDNTFKNGCTFYTLKGYTNNRELKSDKTSITLNDEYYDDGSGKLVPIKHPDLSTQPSILPYKFMGQYVYEQLIPMTLNEWQSGGLAGFVDNNVFDCEISILKSDVLVNLKCQENDIIIKMISIPVVCNPVIGGFHIRYQGDLDIIYYAEPSSVYLRIEYCMNLPEEDDYYGYNNY